MGRVREIAQVATKHGFGFVFERHALRRSTVIEAQNLPALGRHLREMLDELGPTFVKFGQLLSTRPDIVPPEIVSELRLLQDSVSPVAYREIERVVETELTLADRPPVHELRPGAGRGRVDRPGALRRTARTGAGWPSRCSGRTPPARWSPT